LNSDAYWEGSYPADDTLGAPCSTSFLDAKATDDKVPLLFGFIPVAASPHAQARVEIRRVIRQTGLLPWAIPEVDPKTVAAIFVNEDSGAVMGSPQALVKQALPSNDPLAKFNVWSGAVIDFQLNSNNVGVVILISRSANPSLSGSLAAICGQNPAQTRCVTGSGNESGASFIHGYSGQNGTLAGPVPKQVELQNLTCTNDQSAPYFLMNGGCQARVQAVIDFGVAAGGDPRLDPYCVSVNANLGGGAMTWSANGLGGPLGTWTANISLPAAGDTGGRNELDLSWKSGHKPNKPCSGGQVNSDTLDKVAAPYVANDNSDPIDYLEIQNLNPPPFLANSIDRGSGKNFKVIVGLEPTLDVAQPTDPPIYLRLTTNSSQTRAVDCDDNQVQGPAGKHSNFKAEVEDGCFTPYTWNVRDGDCSNYANSGLPPNTVDPNPVPDCVITQTGVTRGQISQALEARFGGNPCKTLNHWPKNPGDPLPPDNDPRRVTLFIVDETAFQGTGNNIFPVRKFGGFYVTGGEGLNCPGDDPAPPGSRNGSVWGHFINYVLPDPNAGPSEVLCEFDELETCVPVLVE
jgi:hypothetical protein